MQVNKNSSLLLHPSCLLVSISRLPEARTLLTLFKSAPCWEEWGSSWQVEAKQSSHSSSVLPTAPPPCAPAGLELCHPHYFQSQHLSWSLQRLAVKSTVNFTNSWAHFGGHHKLTPALLLNSGALTLFSDIHGMDSLPLFKSKLKTLLFKICSTGLHCVVAFFF